MTRMLKIGVIGIALIYAIAWLFAYVVIWLLQKFFSDR